MEVDHELCFNITDSWIFPNKRTIFQHNILPLSLPLAFCTKSNHRASLAGRVERLQQWKLSLLYLLVRKAPLGTFPINKLTKEKKKDKAQPKPIMDF